MNDDDANLQCIKRLTEALCTSGQSMLDESKIKALKSICKQSDEYVAYLFKLLSKWLKKKHAEIRFSAFQVCNDIFLRSHYFRQLVLKDFKSITELVLGINPKCPLPKPTPVANKLKEFAIKCIKEWHTKYKDAYHKLNLSYKYLKESKSVDFENFAIWTSRDRLRHEEEQRKEIELRERKIDRVKNEIEEHLHEIDSTMKQYKNCFKLLIPDLKDFFIPISQNDFDDDSGMEADILPNDFESIEYESDFMRTHGLLKEMSIQINLVDIHKVQESSDNEVLVTTLKEQVGIMEKVLLKVKEWEKLLACYATNYPELLKQIIDIKVALEGCIKKFNTISFLPSQTSSIKNKPIFSEDSDSDDDLVDVPFDDPRIIDAAISESLMLKKDKISSQGISQIDLSEAGPSGVYDLTKEPLKHKKQTVDCFLQDNWEPPVKCISNSAGLSQVWLANDSLHTEEVRGPGLLGIDTQRINYKRHFVPIVWECRTPLPSGRLCPRKDREVCPLHGLVVPRDEAGKPLKLEDAKRDMWRKEDNERRFPSWQDPTLLADIRATTGVDLDMKNVRKRKRKYQNLTDLKSLENAPRKRLKKKIFNKRTNSRINKSLAKLDK